MSHNRRTPHAFEFSSIVKVSLIVLSLLALGTVSVDRALATPPTPPEADPAQVEAVAVAVPITVTTSPGGLKVLVDGTEYTAPQVFNWEPGSPHTLNVASPQSGAASTQYVWTSWSDGGNQSHEIVVPGSGTTYTANFKTQYQVTFGQNGIGSDTGTNTVVTVDTIAKAAGDLPFSKWVDSGSTVIYTYQEAVATSPASGKRYRLTSVTGPLSPWTVLSGGTITGNYVTQYQVTFAQSGIGGDTGPNTVVTVDTVAKAAGDLPFSKWVDSGSTVSYSYEQAVATSPASGKGYRLTSVTGPASGWTVSAAETITGYYDTWQLAWGSSTFQAQYSDPTNLKAVLTKNGNPVSGVTISFAVGTDSGSAMTDATGSTPADQTRLTQPAGSYTATAGCSVQDCGVALVVSHSFEILREDATIIDFTPEVVMIDGSDNDIDLLTIGFKVVEVADGYLSSSLAGSGLENAKPIAVSLTPVGFGNNYGCSATNTTYVSGSDDTAAASCDISDVVSNVYDVSATIGGNYFTGSGTGVVSVMNPELGFTTGGGWLMLDGTRVRFSFNAKILKSGQARSSVLTSFQYPGGQYVVKRAVVSGLAITESAEGWHAATITGKATYAVPRTAGVLDCGERECDNYRFTIYVEDRGEPGTGRDRYWIQVKDPSNNVVAQVSMSAPATANAATIKGGNIQVPHAPRKKPIR